MMLRSTLLASCLAAPGALLSLTAVARSKSWSCKAPGLVSGSFSGGATACIHLEGFSKGGTYPVTKKAMWRQV
jgi:hypothetical protein